MTKENLPKILWHPSSTAQSRKKAREAVKRVQKYMMNVESDCAHIPLLSRYQHSASLNISKLECPYGWDIHTPCKGHKK